MVKKIKKILKNFSFINDINLFFFKIKWRRLNKHNFTEAHNKFYVDKVRVGNYTYGDIHIEEFGQNDKKLDIGSYCSIAKNVTFLLGGEHNYKRFSTYAYKKKFMNIDETISKGDIIVEDDVWIGYGCIILSGVVIGKGSVIGAGSVVSKNVPAYAIYANGKILKYRFEPDVIEELLKTDYNKLNKDNCIKNINLLYEECNKNNISIIKNKLNI